MSRTVPGAIPAPALQPKPIPRNVGIDMSRSHHGGDPTTPELESLYGKKVATIEFKPRNGGAPVRVDAVAYDTDHYGHVVEGSLRDAVRVAREEAAVDEIDMPSLSAAGIVRVKPGVYNVVQLWGFEPGADVNDAEPVTNLPLDAARGPKRGPGGIWDELGYGRPGQWAPDAIKGAFTVRAQRAQPNLVALVGVDRWIDFEGNGVTRTR